MEQGAGGMKKGQKIHRPEMNTKTGINYIFSRWKYSPDSISANKIVLWSKNSTHSAEAIYKISAHLNIK